MAFDWLKPKPATRITTSWGIALVDALNFLYGWLTSGQQDVTLNTLLANYGFFNQNVLVQGKPVIKDGDPISLYDIFSYAQAKITAALDSSSYLRRLGDIYSRFAQIYMDSYGRVGVAIYDDKVGLAKDTTLSTVSSKLDKLDELGRLELIAYTTTPLAANGTWTSSTDSSTYTRFICGSVYADQPGTLYVEQSPDGTNWDIVDSYSVSAGAGLSFRDEKVLPYARVRYVNGATAQTVFRLYVYRRLRI